MTTNVLTEWFQRVNKFPLEICIISQSLQIKQMAAPPAVEDNVMEDSNHSVSSMDSSTSSVLDSLHVTPESRTQHNGSHNTQPQMVIHMSSFIMRVFIFYQKCTIVQIFSSFSSRMIYIYFCHFNVCHCHCCLWHFYYTFRFQPSSVLPI